MNDKPTPVNPLFAAAPTAPKPAISAASAARRTARIGGYGGAALAAWLVTAVATGVGVAAADTTSGSSGSSSSSSSSSSADSTSKRATDDSSSTDTDDSSTSDDAADDDATDEDATDDDATDEDAVDGDAGDDPAHDEGDDVEDDVDDENSAQDDAVDDVTDEDAADVEDSTTDGDSTSPPVAVTPAVTTQTISLDESDGEIPAAEGTAGASDSSVEESADDADEVVATAAAAQRSSTPADSSSLTTAAVVETTSSTTQVAFAPNSLGGILNNIVTTLLNPFLAPPPDTGEPFTPFAWAVLGWVRRELFNQAPVIAYNRDTTVQTGQTVNGNIGAVDVEGDTLTYKITKGPKYGTLTIDQATGNFAYTPDDINYTAAQTDSFTISVTDKKFNLLSLFSPRSDKETIGVTTLNPMVERVILSEADLGVKYPWVPRFSEDGNSLYFTATPLDYVPGSGARAAELYIVNVDGSGIQCLTCDIPAIPLTGQPGVDTRALFKVVPTYDGTGRVLIQSESGSQNTVIYEPEGYEGNETARLVNIIMPAGGYLFGVAPLQEPRISPDGEYILFNRLGAGQGFYFGVISAVGKLDRTTNAAGDPIYQILDARVIAEAGESKNWSPDGKGIAGLFGLYEQGNADNVLVDLATGEVTRLNGNLDYDEDMDLSPNMEWMAVGSLRGFDGLTPYSRIARPATLPTYFQGPVYYQYALPINISNQAWLVAVEDDLKGENGIPLFVQGDGLPGEPNGDDWTARSMPGFNADGTAVTFWEYNIDDPVNTEARLVIAKLKYTTSVGTIEDRTTPELSDSFPLLSGYTLKPPALPNAGTSLNGPGGGSLTITEIDDPVRGAGWRLRTTTYNNYVNEDGLILNGFESTSSQANLALVHYLGDIQVSGAQTGYLRGDATIDTLGATNNNRPTVIPNMVDENGVARSVTSSLDGDVLHLLDPARYALQLAEQ